MKFLKFLLVGIFFGIVLVKSEAVSWYRIYEMFKFQAFHMYGIIGSAVFLGVLFIWLFKKYRIKSIEGITPLYFNGAHYLLLVCDDGDRKKEQGAHYVLIDTKELDL